MVAILKQSNIESDNNDESMKWQNAWKEEKNKVENLMEEIKIKETSWSKQKQEIELNMEKKIHDEKQENFILLAKVRVSKFNIIPKIYIRMYVNIWHSKLFIWLIFFLFDILMKIREYEEQLNARKRVAGGGGLEGSTNNELKLLEKDIRDQESLLKGYQTVCSYN